MPGRRLGLVLSRLRLLSVLASGIGLLIALGLLLTPQAPDSRTAGRLSLPPATYPVQVAGVAQRLTVTVHPDQVEPVLLAVRDGQIVSGGIYVGVQNVNLGLQELSGRLTPLFDFHLV